MANKTGAGAKNETKVINGKRFVKDSCSSTKSAANKKADGIRAAGNTARVIKTGAAHCVFKGPKSKAKRGKAKASTTKKRR